MKTCGCGCGERLNAVRSNADYASSACRTRAWKARVGYADTRRPHPSRNANRGKAQKPSVRISYRKAVEAVAAIYIDADRDPDAAREFAERILEPLLTPAGRRALRR